jgi:chaperonin cofactor prefoldin
MESNFWVIIGFQTIGLAGIGVKIYTDMKVKFREHDLRLKTLEKKEDDTVEQFKEIMAALNDIKLELKDKQDRQ